MPPAQRKKAHVSHPIQSFAGWDRVYDILDILRQLESGQFRNAAMLADAMGRQARIDAVVRTRIGAMAAAKLDITPSDERAKSKKVAEMLGGVEDGPGEWERILPQGTEAQLRRSGLLLNFALAEITWSTDPLTGMWWPRLKFWHPSFVRWDQSRRTYRLMTEDAGEIDLPNRDANPIGDGQWFIWCPFGYENAYLGGMIRGLANPYMRLMWTDRDWPRSNEVNGQPVRKAIVPDRVGIEDQQDTFFQAVANYHSEATVMVPQDENGKGYDLELVEATARIWESFKDAKTDANTDVAVLVLGQNLTTEATGGGLGDGGASIHNLLRLDKAEEDAAFEGAFRDQVLIPWAQINFKDGTLAPVPRRKVKPPEDHDAKAKALESVGRAVKACQEAGIPIDPIATAESFGVLMLSEEQQRKLAEEKAKQVGSPAVGDRVKVIPGKEHMPEHEGVSGTVKIVQGQAIGVQFDGIQGIHKWYATDELQAVGGQSDLDEGGAGTMDDSTPTHDDPQDNGKMKMAELRAKAARRTFVATSPSKRYEFAGLPIAVENAAGTTRTWLDEDGNTTGSTHMHHDYGFIEGHAGTDGDELDVYIGPNEGASHVYVVHQLRAPAFEVHDEDKVMLGFDGEREARTAYAAHRNDGEAAIGAITGMPLERFKGKLERRRGAGKIAA